MVKVASRELIPMKLSFLKSICLSVSFWIIPSAPVLANDGYWKGGYWCSPENNYCRETLGNRYNGGWGNQNYYQPLESIEYNEVIIVHQQVPPRTDVCPWVVNRGLPCDGYQGFNASTRTHIFRNNGNWNNNSGWNNNRNWNNQWQNPGWNNNQWGNQQWNNNGGCLFKQWTKNGGFQVGNC